MKIKPVKMKDKYQIYCDELGKDLRVSGRIVKSIRDAYYNQYLGAEWGDIYHAVVSTAHRKCDQVERSSRTERFEMITHLSKEHFGLERASFAKGQLIKFVPKVAKTIGKLGFYKSLIRLAHRLTEEQFTLIIKPL